MDQLTSIALVASALVAPVVPIASVTPPTPVAVVDSVALLIPIAPLTSVAPLTLVAQLAPVALLGLFASSLASQQPPGQPLKQTFITITSTLTDYDLWHAFKGSTIALLHSGQGQGSSWLTVLQPLPPDLPLSERFQ